MRRMAYGCWVLLAMASMACTKTDDEAQTSPTTSASAQSSATTPASASAAPSAAAKPAAKAGKQLEVSDGLDDAVVARIISSNYQRFEKCWQAIDEPGPKERGELVVRFGIGPDGASTKAKSSGSSLENEELISCLTQALDGLSFPKPKDGKPVKVAYPFSFDAYGPIFVIEASTEAELDPKQIQRVMRMNQLRFKGCFEKELKRDPKAQGEVKLQLAVMKSGGVSAPRSGGTKGKLSAELVSCVVQASTALRFPSSTSMETVSYPLVFSP